RSIQRPRGLPGARQRLHAFPLFPKLVSTNKSRSGKRLWTIANCCPLPVRAGEQRLVPANRAPARGNWLRFEPNENPVSPRLLLAPKSELTADAGRQSRTGLFQQKADRSAFR